MLTRGRGSAGGAVSGSANPVSWDQPQIAAVLEKYRASILCAQRAARRIQHEEKRRRDGFRSELLACAGLMPTPSLVMIAEVSAFCLNSSHTYLRTAVNGASSGTLTTLYGSLGSEVSVTLNCTCGEKAQQTQQNPTQNNRSQVRKWNKEEARIGTGKTGRACSCLPSLRAVSRTLFPDAAGGMARALT